MKTLYLTDLDGTFFNKDAAVSKFSADTINFLIENGCYFSVATARTFATVMQKFSEVKLNLPLILMNGVLIYDPIKKFPIKIHTIDKHAAEEVLSFFKNENLSPMLYFEKDGLLTIKHNTSENSIEQNKYLNDRSNLKGKIVEKTDNLTVNDEDHLIYIVNIDAVENSSTVHEKILACENVSCAYYRDNYTNAYFLETLNKDVSKASGALMLKEMLGVDRIVAFGDNLNDLPIFEIADECYAVENAAQQLKDKASGIIGSNDEDSVAKFLLERYQRGEL